MKNVGLARGTVKLVPHDSNWHMLFHIEAEVLHEKLAIELPKIQHVGSTSIPGILAKPIVDIAVCVGSLDIAETWVKILAKAGYWYKGIQPDMPDRRFLPKDRRAGVLFIYTS